MIWVYTKKFESPQKFRPQQSRPYIAEYLSDFLKRPVAEDEIVYSSTGKPVFKNSEVHFSVSHSETILMFVCSKENKVGIDVQVPAGNIAIGVIQSTLTEKEKSQRHWQQGKVQFFDVWTIKEAAVKLTGHGLSYPFDQIEIDFNQEQVRIGATNLYYKKLEMFPGVFSYLVQDRIIDVRKIKILVK